MSSGIYKITNINNDKIYIGCSNNCNDRFIKHISKLNKNKHNNQHLQNAWNRDGKDNFKFEIIFLCSIQDMEDSEIYFISHYNSTDRNIGYNKHIGGRVKGGINHPNYGKKRSKEAIDKFKISMNGHITSEETKEKIRKSNLGLKRSTETKNNISLSQKGKCGILSRRFGIKHSEETKIKISNTKKKQYIEKQQVNDTY